MSRRQQMNRATTSGGTRRRVRDTGRMGFNPYRKFTAKPSDYVLVVACVFIAAALVAWAFLG